VTSSTGRSERCKSAPEERNVSKDVAPHGSKTLGTRDPQNDAAGTSNESPLKIDAIAYVMLPCMLTRRSDAMKAAAMANNQGNTVGGRKRAKSAREMAASDERVTNVATACRPDDKRTNVSAASSRPMTRKEL
jgi:hypothetical protein